MQKTIGSGTGGGLITKDKNKIKKGFIGNPF